MAIDLNETGLEAGVSLEDEAGRQIRELPFQILVCGDFNNGKNSKPFAERAPIEIDRDNFDDVLGRFGPQIEIAAGETLEFRSIEDFHPDNIFENLPAFSRLRKLRQRLKDSTAYAAAASEARALFGIHGDQSPDQEIRGSKETGGLLAAILSGKQSERPPSNLSSDLGRLIDELVRPHLVAVDENEQQSLLAAADASISAIMRAILHSKDFRHLEGTWRGLYFLCRQTATSTDLKIFVLDVSKAELAADLKSAENVSESRFYQILVRDAVETVGSIPFSLVVGDYAFSGEIDDIAALIRIGKIALAAGAPFVSHIRPNVIGISSFAENPNPKMWRPAEDAPAAKLWKALRSTPEAKSLGMTAPRFIGRLPFGADTDPTERFAFEEFDGQPAHDDYLWLNGGYAAAALLAKGFSRFGWEMGRSLPQEIGGLPVHIYKENGETVYKPCAEILMTDQSVQRLVEEGFMPLISDKSTDRVRLGKFQSISLPPARLAARWN
ncbi:MAG: hypothetical protein C4324_01310 [Blastocatellia bacterium]